MKDTVEIIGKIKLIKMIGVRGKYITVPEPKSLIKFRRKEYTKKLK